MAEHGHSSEPAEHMPVAPGVTTAPLPAPGQDLQVQEHTHGAITYTGDVPGGSNLPLMRVASPGQRTAREPSPGPYGYTRPPRASTPSTGHSSWSWLGDGQDREQTPQRLQVMSPTTPVGATGVWSTHPEAWIASGVNTPGLPVLEEALRVSQTTIAAERRIIH